MLSIGVRGDGHCFYYALIYAAIVSGHPISENPLLQPASMTTSTLNTSTLQQHFEVMETCYDFPQVAENMNVQQQLSVCVRYMALFQAAGQSLSNDNTVVFDATECHNLMLFAPFIKGSFGTNEDLVILGCQPEVREFCEFYNLSLLFSAEVFRQKGSRPRSHISNDSLPSSFDGCTHVIFGRTAVSNVRNALDTQSVQIVVVDSLSLQYAGKEKWWDGARDKHFPGFHLLKIKDFPLKFSQKKQKKLLMFVRSNTRQTQGNSNRTKHPVRSWIQSALKAAASGNNNLESVAVIPITTDVKSKKKKFGFTLGETSYKILPNVHASVNRGGSIFTLMPNEILLYRKAEGQCEVAGTYRGIVFTTKNAKAENKLILVEDAAGEMCVVSPLCTSPADQLQTTTSLARADEEVSERFYSHMTTPLPTLIHTAAIGEGAPATKFKDYEFHGVRKNLDADLEEAAVRKRNLKTSRRIMDSSGEVQSLYSKKPKVKGIEKFNGANLDHSFFAKKDTQGCENLDTQGCEQNSFEEDYPENSDTQGCEQNSFEEDYPNSDTQECNLKWDDYDTAQEQRELDLRWYEERDEVAKPAQEYGKLKRRTPPMPPPRQPQNLKTPLSSDDADSESSSLTSGSGSEGSRRSKRQLNLTVHKQRQKELQRVEEETAALLRKKVEQEAETKRKQKQKEAAVAAAAAKSAGKIQKAKAKQQKQKEKDAAAEAQRKQNDARRKQEEKEGEARRKTEEKEGEARRKKETEAEAKRKHEEKEAAARHKQAEAQRKQEEKEAAARQKQAEARYQEEEAQRTQSMIKLQNIQDALELMTKENEKRQLKDLEERLTGAIRDIKPQASQTDSGKATELLREITNYSGSLLASVSTITHPAFTAFAAMTSSTHPAAAAAGAAKSGAIEETGKKDTPEAVPCIDDFGYTEMRLWTVGQVQRWLDFHNLSALCSSARQASIDGLALVLLHENAASNFEALADEIWSKEGNFAKMRLKQQLTMWATS
jgi:hypothetical protein